MRRSYPLLQLSLAALLGGMLTSCGDNHESPGLEYAPQMYHTIAYDPYSQVADTSSEYDNTIKFNPTRSNMRKPVAGTVARKYYAGSSFTSNKTEVAKTIMVYENIHPDSIDYAAKVLKNPLEASEANLERGKALYARFCSPCHGGQGAGDGTVADLYKGVANLQVKLVSEGHIFHTITHGKGRMWPHGSQINPDDRWRIAMFVKSIQQQPAAAAPAPAQ